MMLVALTEVTQFALPAISTEALERVDPIDAGSAIAARGTHTVIHI